MSATVKQATPSVASAEEQAREDLLQLRHAREDVFTSPRNLGNSSTFVSCCGSSVVNAEGKVSTGYTDTPWIAPLDEEAWLKEAKRYVSEWHYIADYQRRRAGGTPQLTDQEREQYENAVRNTATKLRRGNNPGVTLGVGISKEKLIAVMYTPDNPLYGTVEGFEWNDPDDGLCSLIWTNA